MQRDFTGPGRIFCNVGRSAIFFFFFLFAVLARNLFRSSSKRARLRTRGRFFRYFLFYTMPRIVSVTARSVHLPRCTAVPAAHSARVSDSGNTSTAHKSIAYWKVKGGSTTISGLPVVRINGIEKGIWKNNDDGIGRWAPRHTNAYFYLHVPNRT